MHNHNIYNSGPADVWYSGHKADIWVEYKYVNHIPNTKNFKLDLSELQDEWLRLRYAEGRSVFVVLGTKLGGIIFFDLEWVLPFTRDQLIPRIIDRQGIARWISLSTKGSYEAPAKARNRIERCV
jgi:hypothetical protein